MPTVKNVGEPCAGEPHARFDVGGGRKPDQSATPRGPGASRRPYRDPLAWWNYSFAPSPVAPAITRAAGGVDTAPDGRAGSHEDAPRPPRASEPRGQVGAAGATLVPSAKCRRPEASVGLAAQVRPDCARVEQWASGGHAP